MVDFQQRDRGRTGDAGDDAETTDGGDADRGGDPDVGDGHHEHDVEELSCAVLTVSSSRTLDSDPGGDAVVAALEASGHEIVVRELVGDGYDRVQSTVEELSAREDVDLLVTTGGTGVTPDDVTVESVEGLFEKELPGFGELFRRLSYDEIGTAVVGTRATAGVTEEVPVFCLPGSEAAARLGTREIIVEEAGHLVGLADRSEP
jgi:molybdenum cofactor biosynthesis protein B